MEKPIILIEQEMKEDIVEVVNKYIPQLPATMIATVLDTLHNTVVQLAEQQLQQAKEEYYKEENVCES